jgi:hypothetical protein
MGNLIGTGSPLEILALWRLNFLSGDDMADVCMLWLEHDLDGGDPDIAAFAGQRGLVREAVAPAFERILNGLTGRTMERDEAILRALRLHLDAALKDDNLRRGVQLVIHRFRDLSDRRLVHNPRRTQDRPNEIFAEQNLGLEYIYGGFYAFDDVLQLSATRRSIAERELLVELRQSVQELHDFLSEALDA